MPPLPSMEPLKAFCGRVDARELVWVDRLYVALIEDHSRREALARASKQETLSLILNAQVAILIMLREKTHSRYWSLLKGTAVTVE
jgi:hypothetical protein